MGIFFSRFSSSTSPALPMQPTVKRLNVKDLNKQTPRTSASSNAGTARTDGYFATPRTSRTDQSETEHVPAGANINASKLIQKRETLNMRSPAQLVSSANQTLSQSHRSQTQQASRAAASGSKYSTPREGNFRAGGSISSLPPPGTFVIHRVDPTHVKLSWKPVAQATHYVVHNLTTGGSTGRCETNAVISGLEAGREYSFSVSSADRFGQSAPCHEQKVLMPDDVEGTRGVRKTLRRKLNSSTAQAGALEQTLRKAEAKIANLERRLDETYNDCKEKLQEKDLEIQRLKEQLGQAGGSPRSPRAEVKAPSLMDSIAHAVEEVVHEAPELTLEFFLNMFDDVDDDGTGFAPRLDLRKRVVQLWDPMGRVQLLADTLKELDTMILEREDFEDIVNHWLGC